MTSELFQLDRRTVFHTGPRLGLVETKASGPHTQNHERLPGALPRRASRETKPTGRGRLPLLRLAAVEELLARPFWNSSQTEECYVGVASKKTRHVEFQPAMMRRPPYRYASPAPQRVFINLRVAGEVCGQNEQALCKVLNFKQPRGRFTVLQSLAHRYLPHLLIAIAVGAVAVGAYASVAFAPPAAKITWSADPVNITFSAGTGSGSQSVSFSCSENPGPIQLRTKSGSPAIIALTTSPSSFPSCPSSSTAILITATCIASPASLCVGRFTGTIQVRVGEYYRTLPAVLNIIVVVTS